MTENDMLTLLRDEFKDVTKSVNKATNELSSVKTTLGTVNDTLKEHKISIKEVREAQLQCPALGGWPSLNREIKELKNVRPIRDDEPTGQIDVHADGNASVATISNGFKKWIPWLITTALLGSGLTGAILSQYFMGS